jgi:hypothetical protein
MGRIYDTQRDKVIMEAILEAKNLPAVVVREKFEKSDLATALTAADQAIHALEEAHAGGNGSAPGMLAALVDNNAAQDQIGIHLLPLIVDAKSKKAVTAERMKTSMETESSYFYTVASNAAAVDALRAPIGALVEPLRKLGVDVNDADAAYKAVTETYPNASSLIEAYNKKSAIKLADTENKDETKQKAGKMQLEEIEAAYSQAADKKHWERFAKLQEAERTGAALSFRYVTVLPAALIVLFSLIYLYDLSRGGYKAESIGGGHH